MEQNPFDDIKCPNCGHRIPVTEAIFHQIADRTREEFRAEAIEQQKLIAAKERKIKERESAVDRTIQERVAAAQAKFQLDATKHARDAVSVELEALRQQADEKQKQLKAAQDAELELRKQKRALEDRENSLAIDMQRKLDEERKLIEEQTTKRLQEQYQFRDAERDKKLRDAIATNDELRRKLEQGSQQTQGEVQELELEAILRSSFPVDTIEPVPKGVSGADIIQRVVHRNGHLCGTILWESKRTKSWSELWIQKLKDDQRSTKADIAIIVSSALPKDCNHFTQINGVWVVSQQCAIGLALALRAQLVEIAIVKLAVVGKNEKMEGMYEYLSGSEFRQRIDAIVDAFVEMEKDLIDERRAAERRWAKREKQIRRVISNTSGFYGDLQGLLGSALQTIPALSDGEVDVPSDEPEPQFLISGEPTLRLESRCDDDIPF